MGRWIYWRPDGSIECEGDYVQGLLNGTWRRYDTKGQLADELTMKAGSVRNPPAGGHRILIYKPLAEVEPCTLFDPERTWNPSWQL